MAKQMNNPDPVFEYEGWKIYQIYDCGETFYICATTPADALILYLKDARDCYEGNEISVSAVNQQCAMREMLDEYGKNPKTMATVAIESISHSEGIGADAFYLASTVRW